MPPSTYPSCWPPKGVVFDLDGLVLDSERFYCRAWQRAAAELGFVLSDELYADLVGIPNAEAEQILARILGSGFPVENFAGRWRGHWQKLVESERIPSKPAFEELIGILRDRRIPCAIATSSDGLDALRSLGDRATGFSAVVSRDQVPRGKPAPDLFLEAAFRLAVEPADCLALEDSETGLESACAAGMTVILVPDLKPPSAKAYQQAFRVYPSLNEVYNLFV